MLAAGAHDLLARHGALIGARLRVPVKTFLNCTIPALVKSKVGSFLGNERGGRHDFVILFLRSSPKRSF